MARKIWVVTISIALAVLMVMLFKQSANSDIPFNEEIWKYQNTPESGEERHVKSIPDLWKITDDGNVRLRMVRDLKPKLIGLTKTEVVQLLGTPWEDFVAAHPNSMLYLLGTRTYFFDTDGIFLSLSFERGRVCQVTF